MKTNVYTRYVAVLLALIILFGGSAGAKSLDNTEGKAWLNVSHHIHDIGNNKVMVKVVAENTGTITAKQVGISMTNYVVVQRGQRLVSAGMASIDKMLSDCALVRDTSVTWTGELKPKEKHEIKYIANVGDVKGAKLTPQLRYTYLKTDSARFGYTINLREGKGDVVCRSCVP